MAFPNWLIKTSSGQETLTQITSLQVCGDGASKDSFVILISDFTSSLFITWHSACFRCRQSLPFKVIATEEVFGAPDFSKNACKHALFSIGSGVVSFKVVKSTNSLCAHHAYVDKHFPDEPDVQHSNFASGVS